MKTNFKSQNLNMPGVSNPLNFIRDDKSPHWYISYNPSVADYGTDTTSLVLGQGEYMLVLSGDHTDALNSILDAPFDVKTCKTKLALCLGYVREHKEELHKYSDPIF